MTVAERHYQAALIKKLRHLFDGIIILKNDASYMQGVPDLILLYGPYWAMLEVKLHKDSPFQPNQEHYLRLLDDMGFAACVYPENESEVLNALQQTFGLRRTARVAKRK
jgi:hypothetical protein